MSEIMLRHIPDICLSIIHSILGLFLVNSFHSLEGNGTGLRFGQAAPLRPLGILSLCMYDSRTCADISLTQVVVEKHFLFHTYLS